LPREENSSAQSERCKPRGCSVDAAAALGVVVVLVVGEQETAALEVLQVPASSADDDEDSEPWRRTDVALGVDVDERYADVAVVA